METGKPRQKWAIIEWVCWEPDHHLSETTPKLETRMTEALPDEDEVSFLRFPRTSKLFTFDWHGYILKSCSKERTSKSNRSRKFEGKSNFDG
jgi:hypothetical protein